MATQPVPPAPRRSHAPARLAVGLVVAMLAGAPAARGSFLIEDLGSLQGGRSSYGLGMSSNGVMVGTANQADGCWRAVVSPGGGHALSLGAFAPTGNSIAHDVNAGALIVGTSDALVDGRMVQRAFATVPNGTLRDLGTLPGGTSSEALAINDGGWITGSSTVGPTGAVHAFRIAGDGKMVDLGTLAGGTYSVGNDINGSGAVVGTARTGFGAYRAFLYTDDGGMRSLGTLPTGNATYGLGLNDRGEVVGCGDLGDGSHHAFFWSEGSGLMNLGVPSGGLESIANAINGRSEVVGAYRTRTGEGRAVLWRPLAAEVLDLNSLLPASSGWLLSEATGINDQGQIVGTGLYNGELRGFRLSPRGALPPPPAAVPEPSGLALLGLGGAGLTLAWRRRRRRHGRTN